MRYLYFLTLTFYSAATFPAPDLVTYGSKVTFKNIHRNMSIFTEVKDSTYSKLFEKVERRRVNLTIISSFRRYNSRRNVIEPNYKNKTETFFKLLGQKSSKLGVRFFATKKGKNYYLVANGPCFDADKHLIYVDSHSPSLLQIEDAVRTVNRRYQFLKLKYDENYPTKISLFSGEFARTVAPEDEIRIGKKVVVSNLGSVFYVCQNDLVELRKKTISFTNELRKRFPDEKPSKSPPIPFVKEYLWGFIKNNTPKISDFLVLERPEEGSEVQALYSSSYLYHSYANPTFCPSEMKFAFFNPKVIPVYEKKNDFCKIEYRFGCETRSHGWIKCINAEPYYAFLRKYRSGGVGLKNGVALYEKPNGKTLSRDQIVNKDKWREIYLTIVETKKLNNTQWIKLEVKANLCLGSSIKPKVAHIWVKAFNGMKPNISPGASKGC